MWIQTDRRKLSQILINLIGNAVKFTDRGTITLTITLASTDQTAALTFAVTDTGPGIAPDEQRHLFAPFVQAAAGQKAQTGVGLGLAISHRLAELLGGELQVISTVGQGSTFWVTLPLLGRSAPSTVHLDHLDHPESSAVRPGLNVAPPKSSPDRLAHCLAHCDAAAIRFEDQLAMLPADWLASLRAAALRLNPQRALALIRQLPEGSASSQALAQCVDDSRFDRLLDLLPPDASPASFPPDKPSDKPPNKPPDKLPDTPPDKAE
jgi:Histidine kinase-, DNA gyrase B-, and HSP90-like ATPase